jgi:serine/threonine protein kinase
MIANKYIIIEKLNEGSFGQVFKAENIRTKELVAIKVEIKNNQINTLKNEARIYQYLGKTDIAPSLKWYGTNENNNYLVINLLGSSLKSLLKNKKKLSLNNSLIIGIQIFEAIKYIHNKSLLHRDIKPDNFLFDIENQTNKLYLIDFGLCKRYLYNGIHIQQNNIKRIVGSPNFVSINVHRGIEPSRRDDLESCIYIISNMILGDLEWFDCNSFSEMIILKEKFKNTLGLPFFLKNMLNYVHLLKFNENPNYEYLINILANEII